MGNDAPRPLHPLFGQMLLASGRITPQELARALAVQGPMHCRLGEALVEMGILAEEDVEDALRRQKLYDAPQRPTEFSAHTG